MSTVTAGVQNKVIHGDCLDVMRGLPDNAVDLLLTDPPYGLGYSNHNRAGSQRGASLAVCKDYGEFGWDNTKLTSEYFNEMLRVSVNQVIWGGNHYSNFLHNSSCWLVWDKNNGKNQYADCEIAWTSFNSAIRKFKWTWQGFIQEDMKNKEVRYHPTQKPVALFEWVINSYSNECDTIFDPFGGSGTTAIACLNTNRNYILIEKEKEYIDIINKRISEHELQVTLC